MWKRMLSLRPPEQWDLYKRNAELLQCVYAYCFGPGWNYSSPSTGFLMFENSRETSDGCTQISVDLGGPNLDRIARISVEVDPAGAEEDRAAIEAVSAWMSEFRLLGTEVESGAPVTSEAVRTWWLP